MAVRFLWRDLPAFQDWHLRGCRTALKKLVARGETISVRQMSRLRLIALLLPLITLGLYLPVASYDFSIFDDQDYVVRNDIVQNGLTWAGVQWAFTTSHAGNWFPLTWLSHMADCQLFGLKPGAHHIVNVVFHAANAVLLLLLLLRLTQEFWPSALAAALFAWHPLRVESVAWIAERKDVLSMFFALLTLLAYVRYAQKRAADKGHAPSAGTVPCPRFPAFDYFCALVCFALGLLAKPMLVTLPFIMLLLDYWPLGRLFNTNSRPAASLLRLTFEKGPFLALAAASCVITFLVQHHGGMVVALETFPLSYRLGNLPLAYVNYLWSMIWPSNLAVLYPLPEKIPPPAVAVASAILALISAAVWFGRKRCPYCLMGWLWFLGALVPVIGLVTVGGLARADRYTYFPCIGIFLAVALGARDIQKRFQLPKTAVLVAAGLTLTACLAATENQLRYWRNDVALFSHVIETTRPTGFAHLRLGLALEKEGRKSDALAEYQTAIKLEPRRAESHKNLARLIVDFGQPEEAVAEYQTALRLNPGYISAHYEFGLLLIKLGRFDEARQQLNDAVRLDPDFADAHLSLGNLLADSTHPEAGVAEYEAALRIDPAYALAQANLGLLLVKLGRFDEAMKHYNEAARLVPTDWHVPYWMGRARLRQGRDAEAIQHFQAALQIDPDNLSVLTYLAQVLASDEDPKVRDGHAALAMVQRVITLSGGVQPALLSVLAMAQAELGNFDRAQAAAQDAVDLLQSHGMTNYEAIVRQQLQLYQRHQPFRQSFTQPAAKEFQNN
jgi:tetratricopeptide (TPR) repeat protein